MIERVSISDQVLEEIKEKINSGDWPRGTKIPSESELQEMFNVSRNTIRGCMQKLSAIGVLEIKHGEGTFIKDTIYDHLFGTKFPVLPLTDSEIIEMLEFRKMLESANVKVAALKASPTDLERIKKCLDEMIEYKNDYQKYAYADLNFHINIALATQNKISYRIMLMLREMLLPHFTESVTKLKANFPEDLHIDIYEAIKNHDPETAEKCIINQLNRSISLIQTMKK